jgi:hypothetical protein
MAKKELPKSLKEIEFVPYVGRDIDLKTKGKPSVYLKNVIIPHYRAVIRSLEAQIAELRESKKALLVRKDKQLQAKRWLTYKSNQKKYAVQQRKVNEKAVELLEGKIKKARFALGDVPNSLFVLPIMEKIAIDNNMKLEDLTYVIYTSLFHSLNISDYKTYFKEKFSLARLKKLTTSDIISVFRGIPSTYTLSIKGKQLIKELKQRISDEATRDKGN